MPVYNAERFLQESIGSILNQSYRNFELIIINDGSTDSSLSIIKSFAKQDKRIRYITQENRGCAKALNRAIGMSAGMYIARMDADDISHRNRLEEQINYLLKNSECDLVATTIQQIDENGNKINDWPADIESITPEDIFNRMTVENCIAHPSIMIKADLLKFYGYHEDQVPSEDYDLWLRILSDGRQIHKINRKLLFYRVHLASVTQSSTRKSSANRKILRAQTKFLAKQFAKGHITIFELMVLRAIIKRCSYLILMRLTRVTKWQFASVSKTIRNLIIIRKIINYILPRLKEFFLLTKMGLPSFRENKKRVLLIAPIMALGGAEKIMLDICKQFKKRGYEPYFISSLPHSAEWREQFERSAKEVFDVGNLVSESNRARFITRYIKYKKIRYVITTNNLAGYQLAKIIKEKNMPVSIVDLIHGQGGENDKGGWPLLSLPFDKFLDKRVVATDYMKDYLTKKHSIKKDKIYVVHNGINKFSGPIPKPAKEVSANTGKFIILWAGRFSFEKHPELAIETAKIVAAYSKEIHFVLAGDGYLKEDLINKINKYRLDNVTISKKAYTDPYEYMAQSNVLLMTSEMEGFPVVILEAFSCGLPVIATNVGGINEIIMNGENGYLIDYNKDLPKEAAKIIINLSKDPKLARGLGKAGKKLVEENFTLDAAVQAFIDILGMH